VNKQQEISNRQLIILFFIYVISYSSIYISKISVKYGDTAGWIIMLISGLVMTYPVVLYTYLGYVHRGKSLFEYGPLLVGKPLTYVFMFGIMLLHFSVASMASRITVDIVNTNLLDTTPIRYSLLPLLLVIYYISIQKISNIARVMEFFGIIIIITFITVHILVATQGDLQNVLPVFAPLKIKNILMGSLAMIAPYGGATIMSTIPLGRNNTKKLIFLTFAAIIASALYYIFITECDLIVLGADRILRYANPGLMAVRITEIPYLEFFRRPDGLILFTWIAGFLFTNVLCIYIITFFITKIFKNANYNIVAAVIIVLCYILALLPQMNGQAKEILDVVLTSCCIGMELTAPVVLFIASKAKGFKANQHLDLKDG